MLGLAFIPPFERVYRLWVVLERGEDLAFLARLGILKRLVVLDLAPLTISHVLPQEVVLDSPLVLFIFGFRAVVDEFHW